MKERFPTITMELSDRDECSLALNSYQRLLMNRDICEGDCSRGQNCPTGSEAPLPHMSINLFDFFHSSFVLFFFLFQCKFTDWFFFA